MAGVRQCLGSLLPLHAGVSLLCLLGDLLARARRCGRGFSNVLDDQDGRLVGVVVSLSNDAECPPADEDRVAGAPARFGRLESRRVSHGAVLGLEPEQESTASLRFGGAGRQAERTEKVPGRPGDPGPFGLTFLARARQSLQASRPSEGSRRGSGVLPTPPPGLLVFGVEGRESG
jgi:hypothetical protein